MGDAQMSSGSEFQTVGASNIIQNHLYTRINGNNFKLGFQAYQSVDNMILHNNCY